MPADAGPNDATWVGSEVHADVHRITWETPGGVSHVWVGCDGGVFRSIRAGRARDVRGQLVGNGGGWSLGFLANHPISPGPVLAGMQDNGTQLRIGEGVWRSAVRNGDARRRCLRPGRSGPVRGPDHSARRGRRRRPIRDADVPAHLNAGSAFRGRGRPGGVLLVCRGHADRRRDSRHAAGSGHRPGVVQRSVGPLPLGRRGVAAPMGDAADGHRPAGR